MPKKNKVHPTTQYALDITSGKIPANKWTRLACKRHLDDLETGGNSGLYFDESAANHIILFFEGFLVFYEGEFDGKPFLLTPHQKFILGSIFGWKKKPDGYRRFKTVYIEEAKGNGKALSVDTPIPTPNGWTTMGEIKSGDQIFGDDGNVINVIATTPIMENRECYRLKFNDGAEVIADADHLWKTHTQITEDGLKTTREIFETLIAGHRINGPLSQNWMITSCDRIDSVPVRCIQVNAPSGMFLAGKEMIPTHNSPLAAGVGLYGLCFDDEPGAEIYSCATTREQAGILFRDAHNFAEKSPSLKEFLHIDKYNIAYEKENGFFRPISSEHRGLDGKRPHIALIDEIHEHPNDLVVRKMSAGTKGRRSPLVFEITNSGYDRNSICYQHHDYTKKILEGIVQNDEWFGMISGLDVCSRCESEGKTVPQDGCSDCDDWRDEKNFIKANPNLEYLGKPFKDYLMRQVEEAKAMPSQENIVKRLNFNIWCVALDTLISMADGTRKRADELKCGDLILSFDEKTRKIVKRHVIKVIDNGVHPVVKIKTVRGRKIIVTGNHKFWSRYGRSDNPKYGWIEASNIKKGIRIAVGLGHDLPRGSQRMKTIEAHFLGIMIGDGTCAKSGLRITNQNPGIIEFCRNFVESRGCVLVLFPDGAHWGIKHPVKLNSPKQTSIRKLIKKHNLNGKTCFNKRVPSRVFKGGKYVWAAFLSGYLDTDGCVTKRAVIWVSVNKELLEDCQYLLALLGIQSAVRCANNHYRLEVMMTANLIKLANCLKLSHTEKSKKLQKFLIITTTNNMKDRSDFDLVSSVKWQGLQRTIGIEIEGTHTHITNGLITHNTESITKWISADIWNACTFSVDPESLKGRACYGGLDLSSEIDLTAWVMVFPPIIEGGKYEILCRFFLPEDNMRERVYHDKVPYDVWVRQGFIITTPGNIIDYDFVLAQIEKDMNIYQIKELAFDRWGSLKITTNLQDLGFEIEGKRNLIQFGQGYASMSAPTKELNKMILSKEIAHGGNPVLAWMASNIAIKTDPAGNIKPDKEKITEKIDGVVALIMAIGRAMLRKGPEKSIYDDLSYEQIKNRMAL